MLFFSVPVHSTGLDSTQAGFLLMKGCLPPTRCKSALRLIRTRGDFQVRIASHSRAEQRDRSNRSFDANFAGQQAVIGTERSFARTDDAGLFNSHDEYSGESASRGHIVNICDAGTACLLR